MIEAMDAWMREAGALAYFAMGLASLIEYVVPPFPGDSVVLAGGALVYRAQASWVAAFVAVMAGNAVGISANYALGVFLASRWELLGRRALPFGLTAARLEAAQHRMRQAGPWLLVLNRFLPTFRSTLFIAAGAARMRLRDVMAWGLVSGGIWTVGLFAVGAVLGKNAESVHQFMKQYQTVALAAAAFILAVAGALAYLRWRLRAAGAPGGAPPPTNPRP